MAGIQPGPGLGLPLLSVAWVALAAAWGGPSPHPHPKDPEAAMCLPACGPPGHVASWARGLPCTWPPLHVGCWNCPQVELPFPGASVEGVRLAVRVRVQQGWPSTRCGRPGVAQVLFLLVPGDGPGPLP